MLVKNQFSILPNAAFYKHRSETLQYREDLLNTPSENHFICNVQNEQNNVQFDGYLCRKRSMLASNKLAFEKSAFNQLDHFAFCIQQERLDAKLDKTCAEQKFLREKSNSALQLHRQCGTRVSSQKKLNCARTQEANRHHQQSSLDILQKEGKLLKMHALAQEDHQLRCALRVTFIMGNALSEPLSTRSYYGLRAIHCIGQKHIYHISGFRLEGNWKRWHKSLVIDGFRSSSQINVFLLIIFYPHCYFYSVPYFQVFPISSYFRPTGFLGISPAIQKRQRDTWNIFSCHDGSFVINATDFFQRLCRHLLWCESIS